VARVRTKLLHRRLCEAGQLIADRQERDHPVFEYFGDIALSQLVLINSAVA
jgi:hypothetical protein